jgi:hypothetical protein
MINFKQMIGRGVQSTALMVALCLVNPVMAECIQSVPPADTILAIDANNGCTDIQGQEGCKITKWDKTTGYASCTHTYTDENNEAKTFTVISRRDSITGGVSWELDPNTSDVSGIDTAIFGGGKEGKNNCGYVYNYDVNSGIGGDCTDNPEDCSNFQNITSLDICTDKKEDIYIPPPTPQVAAPLPSCQEVIGSSVPGLLDDTGIVCPLDSNENPVVVCNLEKGKDDWGTTDGTPVCCQCGIPIDDQVACVVTEEETDDNTCTKEMTVDPTQTVELLFFRNDGDPCTWKKTSKGWEQVCW